MAARHQQTHAKRAREAALRERRERKRAKKAEAAAQRAAGNVLTADSVSGAPQVEERSGEPGWIQ
ncbi:MAG TPA: hypothetical protein VMG74_00465 [Gaiellaceae bacterium]|nr:hypothetical protein [Gaiellaceae bacterium]